ncbi:bifunctional dTDP-4-dehydrorhamnose 3,5-epimerase family protein/NAD(P)-dependent oxidoreductase [Agromyces sp. H3Y2-19a]|uniref:bifunctional dTDP-4-dehydrorhamnose 3,5-epimerase family protein/NAD(P)-dependent oxidoreductase n=1 Tax=Agromyces TaxID=33877 RepID=UPI0023B8BFE8|nr:bifunctional dTDP-4-dehydrorhamnose 3,5-epimerase family protein/NAD(P)-dependent oxidoreductase [Agromyces chromiiresistens]MDF0514663.1 bifunctional dTDP-4-dehydrorhamnose 3,5-epimerase family protein/NAD(P)-dependent oxidoreductase [Agromyces chromiiresistens]
MSGDALRVAETEIPGLLVLDLPVHADARGWFKENWQREKMLALGLPDFRPVQQNVSYNVAAGTTRGIHAEPWDKLVSIASGRAYCVWVDLREGPTFGRRVALELGPERAVFVPRGVGNSYQTLVPDTAYSYLVNEHWRPDAAYTFVNLADESLAIDWPFPLDEVELSPADRGHPALRDVDPLPARRVVVIGGDGQLGRALRIELPGARFVTRRELDLGVPGAIEAHDWSDAAAIVVAAAYTAVDEAETPDGRRAAWRINAEAVAEAADVAERLRVPLVTVSSDYVFDGVRTRHDVDEGVAPLGVYGQTKAAGEFAARRCARHYIVRTSWVVGEGANFVRTMASLAERGVDPSVVDDQFGRLTFAGDLAGGIRHLLQTRAPYGTYQLSNGGAPQSWFEIARAVFEMLGHDPDRVRPVSGEEYGRGLAAAPRPRHSTLDLAKIEATGFRVRDARKALREYLGEGRTP